MRKKQAGAVSGIVKEMVDQANQVILFQPIYQFAVRDSSRSSRSPRLGGKWNWVEASTWYVSTIRSDRQGRAGHRRQRRHWSRHRQGGGRGGRRCRDLGHQRGEERCGAGGTGEGRPPRRGAAMRCGRRSGGGCGVRTHAGGAGPRGWLLRQCRYRRRRRGIVPGDDQRAMASRAARQSRWCVLHISRGGATHGRARRRRRAGRHGVARGDRGIPAQRALCRDQGRHDLHGACAGGGIRPLQVRAHAICRAGSRPT